MLTAANSGADPAPDDGTYDPAADADEERGDDADDNADNDASATAVNNVDYVIDDVAVSMAVAVPATPAPHHCMLPGVHGSSGKDLAGLNHDQVARELGEDLDAGVRHQEALDVGRAAASSPDLVEDVELVLEVQ